MEPSQAKVLLVDDEQSMREFLGVLLRRMDLDVETAESGDEAIKRITGPGQFALVITDLKMPGKTSGLDVLRHVKEVDPATQVLVMTAFATPETARDAIKDGAYDYITKPFKVDEARIVVERALEKYELLRENLVLRQRVEDRSFSNIIGTSDSMKRVFTLIERVAPTKTTVLIQGESGTGKELVARAIHERSGLSGDFIAINCGAIPENLVEAELFGYVKGAFTGADTDRRGLFEAAVGGTLFLDEVGELPLPTQVRLLRALQERTIKRVGDTKEREVDVRIVAATNRDLRGEIDAGRFREDLFFRLNVIAIELPPLRKRPGDTKLLIEHYIRKYASEIGNPVEGVESDAMRALLEYKYPGNIRELQNIVERAVTLEMTNLVTLDSLPPSVVDPPERSSSADFEVTTDGVSLDLILEGVERDLLEQALALTNGNRTEAAKLLDISFRSIRYRLQKYGYEDS